MLNKVIILKFVLLFCIRLLDYKEIIQIEDNSPIKGDGVWGGGVGLGKDDFDKKSNIFRKIVVLNLRWVGGLRVGVYKKNKSPIFIKRFSIYGI